MIYLWIIENLRMDISRMEKRNNMNQDKIGKFIAEQRKIEKLTQFQLAEKLGVTDRAVSKWENGRAMPDSSIMLELCSILKISVNDLLSGEIVTKDCYNKELENNLLETIKQKEQSDKRLLTIEIVLGVLSVIGLLVPILIGAYLVNIEEWKRVLICFAGFIPAIIGIIYAIRIEQVAGYYECKHCGHKYVPTFKAMSFSMHMGRTRYMKCPNCHKKSWQKKVVSKR